MQGMMPHQGLGQQMVHPTAGGGAQMQGQWRQPLGGQETPPPTPDPPTSEAQELTFQNPICATVDEHSCSRCVTASHFFTRTFL